MSIVLKGLGTATPPVEMTQKEIFDYFVKNFDLTAKEEDMYKRILQGGRIKRRYLGIESKDASVSFDHEEQLARFLKYGSLTAIEAAQNALEDAGITAEDVRGLVVNTCTGYLCPGFSSYVAEGLGLNKNIRVMDLMGMGCGSAVPNLECAAGMVARSGAGPIVSIAVEICSATLFPSHEQELIVSNCIFGDGAAAAVIDVSGANYGKELACFIDFESGLFPEYREELRYRNKGGLLRNTLSKQVPIIGARTISLVVARLLEQNGLSQDDIEWWAVHPGGTLVLSQITKKMKLDEDALRFSYDVFENYGNMSSPSVLFVLQKILDSGHPPAGSKGLLLSFGAGFSAFASLVEF
jgi:predicted naringenin-chalcone synthase